LDYERFKMRGEVVFFDGDTKKGIITDKYKNQYNFHIGEWLSEKQIKEGEKVYFDIPKNEAVNIFINKKENFIKKFLNCLYKYSK